MKRPKNVSANGDASNGATAKADGPANAGADGAGPAARRPDADPVEAAAGARARVDRGDAGGAAGGARGRARRPQGPHAAHRRRVRELEEARAQGADGRGQRGARARAQGHARGGRLPRTRGRHAGRRATAPSTGPPCSRASIWCCACSSRSSNATRSVRSMRRASRSTRACTRRSRASSTPEIPAGSVAAELQKGYRVGERLLRPAMVSVSSGGKPTTPPSEG